MKRGFFGLAMHRNEVGAPVRKAEHPAPFLDPFDFRHSTLGLLSFLVQILMVGSGSPIPPRTQKSKLVKLMRYSFNLLTIDEYIFWTEERTNSEH